MVHHTSELSSFVCICCLAHLVLLYRIDPRSTFIKHRKKAGYLLLCSSLFVFSSGSLQSFLHFPRVLPLYPPLSSFHPNTLCGNEFDIYTHVHPSPKRQVNHHHRLIEKQTTRFSVSYPLSSSFSVYSPESPLSSSLHASLPKHIPYFIPCAQINSHSCSIAPATPLFS